MTPKLIKIAHIAQHRVTKGSHQKYWKLSVYIIDGKGEHLYSFYRTFNADIGTARVGEMFNVLVNEGGQVFRDREMG